MSLFLSFGKYVLQRWENQSGFMEMDIRAEAGPPLEMEIKIEEMEIKIEAEPQPDKIKIGRANRLLPLYCFEQVLNITFDEIDNRGQGVVVGNYAEVQCTSQKVTGAVGNIKLIR